MKNKKIPNGKRMQIKHLFSAFSLAQMSIMEMDMTDLKSFCLMAKKKWLRHTSI